jgi:hypothetical protein
MLSIGPEVLVQVLMGRVERRKGHQEHFRRVGLGVLATTLKSRPAPGKANIEDRRNVYDAIIKRPLLGRNQFHLDSLHLTPTPHASA